MECPRCGRPTQQRSVGGELQFLCPHCGWGRDRGEDIAAGAELVPEKPGTGDWVKLAFMWIASAVIVMGPFFALWFGPSFVDIGLSADTAEGALERWHGLLLVHYWWVMLIYLVLSAVFTPTYDRDNLGLFGSPFIDNPLSWSDDYNRSMRNLLFFLAPGKLVYGTIRATGYTLRAMAGP